ncbi:MAG TPA: TerC family protein [Nevskiaceae bacterium]|nr:TerC family protein [Nevskiaceae bacterium]
MLELLTDPNAWLAFATLAALEIVLGIDNLIFISILAGKLPPEQQARARQTGIAAALVSRLALLFALTWIMKLVTPLFTIAGNEISGKDLVLIFGGLFLIYKATIEIHEKLEGAEKQPATSAAARAAFGAVILQIMVIDIVFSLDSIITAVGMVDHIEIMVAAIIASVGFMLAFAGAVNGFVNRHPTVKMLALAFLLVIGLALIADGFDFHIPKGYIYSAMAFAIIVEVLNMSLRRRGKPVHLHGPQVEPVPSCPHCGQPMPATSS